jgi:hypothetical protein
MSASHARGDRRDNGSARTPAGAHWNASGSENGAGEGVAAMSHTLAERSHRRGSREHHTSPR